MESDDSVPELGLVKFNDPTGEVQLGDPIVYTLVLINESVVEATNVVITDVVPAGTTYQSCTTPVGTCGESTGVVTWSLGNVAGRDQVAVTFTVLVTSTPPSQQIDNVGQASAENAPSSVISNPVSNPIVMGLCDSHAHRHTDRHDDTDAHRDPDANPDGHRHADPHGDADVTVTVTRPLR